MTLTIGGLFTEVRRIISDDEKIRYTDADLVAAFNDALLQARGKRPDAFLEMGLRSPVPQYAMPDDADTAFPLDPGFYSAFLFYIAGRSELRDDTFSVEGRAVVLMNKFVSQLLQVAS